MMYQNKFFSIIAAVVCHAVPFKINWIPVISITDYNILPTQQKSTFPAVAELLLNTNSEVGH